MKEQIRKGKTIVETLLKKPFTLKNTIPASKLREISQKKLKEMIDEDEVIGVIIKDEMSVAMMGMKEFEGLKQYVENLEQTLDEALMVKELGENFFNTPKEQFIKMPENMTANEYREWRKGMKK
ncbi:hypothetical protein J9303_12760 [Bacillaceae bacterium Marseille-Q3522]|nr:hypothetical protein [Bacillaceae bacterium Marseille-Q3522]